jgi:RNA polymerase sigma factor (sigma-70 family)
MAVSRTHGATWSKSKKPASRRTPPATAGQSVADEFSAQPRHIGMTHTTQHVVASTSRFVNSTEFTAGLADAAEFGALAERYRRELHVHCYRMLGSFDEAEDLLQETFFRGGRARNSFQGQASPRAWMYRIATNACLDFLRRNPRKAHVKRSGEGTEFVEVTWIQPYPDTLLDEVSPSEAEPDVVVVKRESIELAFLIAIQLLPARQWAVLLLCDVLDWSAAEVAAWLPTHRAIGRPVASSSLEPRPARPTCSRPPRWRPYAPRQRRARAPRQASGHVTHDQRRAPAQPCSHVNQAFAFGQPGPCPGHLLGPLKQSDALV